MDRTVSQGTDGVVDGSGTIATSGSGMCGGQVDGGHVLGGDVPVAQVPVAQVPVAQAPVAQAPIAQAPVGQATVGQLPAGQAHGPQAPGSRACVCGHGDVMHLLAGHVPLSLLMDLALPKGPPSRDVLLVEGLPEEPWWDGGDPGATRRAP